MELSGNTPPYKKDKLTNNIPIPERMVNSSHHKAVARQKGTGAFCTGFAHSTKNASLVWALCKMLGADSWIGTLKTRLGLPWHILNTIPSEQDIVGQAYGFEKQHPELFVGQVVGQLGVYFSYETRNHTLYGNLNNGYYRDYGDVLRLLFRKGICPHTVFEFPEDGTTYPLIILSGVARMTEEEKRSAERYLSSGGKIIALGPTAMDGCENSWALPNRLDVAPEEFFTSVPDGIHVKTPDWFQDTELPSPADPDVWQNPRKGLYYHPYRLNTENQDGFLELVQRFVRSMPIEIEQAKGYMCTMLEDQQGITAQLLAEDYDVDIDHELDAMRTHRSRINLLTTIEPAGVDGIIKVKSNQIPAVYTPFDEQQATVTVQGAHCTIKLPKGCCYAILRFG
jgi:hypothetical protein